MRSTTQTERLAYRRGVTPDELDELGWGPTRQAIQEIYPTQSMFYVQVKWNGDEGVIRGLDGDTGEVLADFGMGNCYWFAQDEVLQTSVRYTPPPVAL